MPHEILDNGSRRSLHIRIPPIDPAMCRTQSSRQQPIPRQTHHFPPPSLSRKSMPTLKILRNLLTKILFNHRDLPKRHLRIGVRLQLRQHPRQHLQCPIFRIRNQKRQVD